MLFLGRLISGSCCSHVGLNIDTLLHPKARQLVTSESKEVFISLVKSTSNIKLIIFNTCTSEKILILRIYLVPKSKPTHELCTNGQIRPKATHKGVI